MTTDLILSALQHSPLLVEALPEATSFDRSKLSFPTQSTSLSLEQKLGHLYEDAFAQLLDSSPTFQPLEKNLQLQSDIHHTLGELDFLFRDHSNGQLIHLELAVKFYLAFDSQDGLQLPGPDARDNYFKKLARLRSHQLTLTQRYREHLPSIYRKETIHPQHLIIGCLFHHITAPIPAQVEFIPPNARRGKWLRQNEYSNYFSHDSTAKIIPKPLWPASLPLPLSTPLLPLDLNQTLTRCTLVQIDEESTPFFITPDNYPTLGRAC